MQEAYDEAWDETTVHVLRELAEHGACRAKKIADLIAESGIDADDWIDWAARAGVIVQLDDEDPEGPDAVWAISAEHQIGLAREHYRAEKST